MNNNNFVFIVGSGRCGTTLLKNMLDFHEDFAVIPEAQFFKLIYGRRKLFKNFDKKAKTYCVNKVLWVLKNTALDQKENFSIDEESLKNTLLSTGSYKDFLTKLSIFLASKKDFRYLVHNTPSDVFFIDKILKFFPEAKIIHMVRDGREMIASARKRGWGNNNINQVVQWNYSLSKYKKYKNKFSDRNDQFIEIRYKDLILDTSNVFDRLSKFFNTNFNERFLSDVKNVSLQNSSFSSRENGLILSKNFESYFSEKEKKRLVFFLRKRLQRKGYELRRRPMFSLYYSLLYIFEYIKRVSYTLFIRLGRLNFYRKLKVNSK